VFCDLFGIWCLRFVILNLVKSVNYFLALMKDAYQSAHFCSSFLL
jgi:hypothetical protein